MLSPKEDLEGRVYQDDYLESHITGTSRWSVNHSGVFEHEGKFYQTSWPVGATEYQDEQPYEYGDEMIECHEVRAVQTVKAVYKPVTS
jgi:hypothetical protein